MVSSFPIVSYVSLCPSSVAVEPASGRVKNMARLTGLDGVNLQFPSEPSDAGARRLSSEIVEGLENFDCCFHVQLIATIFAFIRSL
jgi:hypothetical protein